jgi:hypothetical protein
MASIVPAPSSLLFVSALPWSKQHPPLKCVPSKMAYSLSGLLPVAMFLVLSSSR